MKVYSKDGEVFNDEDLSDYEQGELYYVGDKVTVKPSELVDKHCIETLMDQMLENLYGRVGEVADGNMDLAERMKEDLLNVIKRYVDESFKVTCYAVENIEEKTNEI